jgi:hypothetical protein
MAPVRDAIVSRHNGGWIPGEPAQILRGSSPGEAGTREQPRHWSGSADQPQAASAPALRILLVLRVLRIHAYSQGVRPRKARASRRLDFVQARPSI